MVRKTSPCTGVTTKGEVAGEAGEAAVEGEGAEDDAAVSATGVAEAATDVGITASAMALRTDTACPRC